MKKNQFLAFIKKRILLIVFAISGINILSAQNNGKDNWTTIPDFTPKSPEAQAFQKYGDYNVNLAKGLVNISVPLYTLDAGEYKLPIELNYNSSGIKVNQEATWVGLGWSLQAGAQITLDVRDSPDENVDEPMPDFAQLQNYLNNEAKPWDYCSGYMTTLRNNSWIKDVYHFSSPTAQGKFILGDSQGENIMVYPPDAFKVEASGNKHSRVFKITDAQGNIYFFNNTRETSIAVGVEHNTKYYTTAWYVDQIKTPVNNTIDFSYVNDGWQANYSINDQITVSKTYSDCNPGAPQNQVMSSSTSRTSTNATKTYKISSITYKDLRILFVPQSGRLDLVAPSLLEQARFPDLYVVPSYLKFVKIQSKTNDTYVDNKAYELLYSYFDANINQLDYYKKRLKLVAVSDMTDDNIATSFTYSNVNIPSKISKSSDAWGYYNGANNFTTLVPAQQIWLNNEKITLGSADRKVSTGNAQAGILTEIKYPTKGKTKFNYESNTYFGINEISRNDEAIISSNMIIGKGNPETDIQENCTPDCLQTNQLTYDISGTASARLTFRTVYTGQNYLTINKYQYARVRVYPNGPGGAIYDSGKMKYSLSFNDPITLSGKGTIIIEAYGQYMSVNDFQCKYTYIDDTEKNVEGPGLRIASIENFTDNSTLVSKKQYTYTIPEQGNKSSGRLVFGAVRKFDPQKFRSYQTSSCGVGTYWVVGTTDLYDGQSPYYTMNEVYYTDVKEENIDFTNTAKNGYTTYNYDFTKSENSQDGAINVEFDWLRGNLLNKKIYNSNHKIVQEETNNYYNDTSKTVTISGIKVSTSDTFITCPNQNNFPADAMPYQNMGYRHTIPWHYLKSKTVTENFYDRSDNKNGSITTNTIYNYNNPVHMQLSSQITISSKGENLESKYFYPGDPDLAGEPFANILLASNRLQPIKSQTFLNSNKISESKKIYKDWGNNLISPEIIQSSKGTAPLENRLRVIEIDNENGNILQQKLESGSDITYLWGYNGLYPIAKIENASYLQVKAALGTTDADIKSLTQLPLSIRTLLPNAFVTTYTYKYGIGISSITDPKEQTTKFEYDNFGRLILTKDTNDKIISENIYNYRY